MSLHLEAQQQEVNELKFPVILPLLRAFIPSGGSALLQLRDFCHTLSALISSTHHGSGACRAEGVGAPVTVLGAQGVEEGTQQVEGLSLEGVRGPAACVEAVVEGSCCSPAEDRLGASWVVGRWKEEEGGLEVELRVGGRREGGTAVSGVRSWAASGRRRDPLSSSSTAGSGIPPRTCRSWRWT